MEFTRTPDALDHCPKCGKVGIELDEPELYEDSFTIRCTCPHCEYEFVDTYMYHHSHD